MVAGCESPNLQTLTAKIDQKKDKIHTGFGFSEGQI